MKGSRAGCWSVVVMSLWLLPGMVLAVSPRPAEAVPAETVATSTAGIIGRDTPDTAPPVGATSPENPPTAMPAAALSEDKAAGSVASRTLVEKLREQGDRKRDPAPSPVTMLGGLAMTLGLLFVLAWLARRLRLNVPGLSHGMRLEAMVALGPREKLCVVSRGEKVYVLGVTQQSISLIDTEQASAAPNAAPDTQFSERIKKLLQNGAPHGS